MRICIIISLAATRSLAARADARPDPGNCDQEFTPCPSWFYNSSVCRKAKPEEVKDQQMPYLD
jgi:hypothetical protein